MRNIAATFFSLMLLAPLALLHAAEPPSTQKPARKPNIILFLVDDMGWMDSQPYGSKYYDTPNMQRMADQGMRFTSAYSMPLCSPTRASILSGQHASRHGILGANGHQPPQKEGHDFLPDKAAPNQPLVLPEGKNYLEPSQYTMAEALRDAGYRTGHFGKWHLGLTEPHWPDRQGFEVAFFTPDPGPPSSQYFSPYYCVAAGAEPHAKAPGGRFTHGTITDGPPGEYITDRLTDESLKFITANKDRPFFLNLWHFGVHGPWGHKEEITAKMAKRTDPTGRQDNPVMASMLKSVDESLGRILDKINELGLANDTLIVFTSDNGGNNHAGPYAGSLAERADLLDTAASYVKWAGTKAPTSNAPLKGGKGQVYEGGIRVPLIVWSPGRIQPGSTSDAVVGCIDIYPTVLDLIGIAPNPKQIIDGVSYAPVLQGTGALSRQAYFTWFAGSQVCVRQGDWKLIRLIQPSKDGKVTSSHELYNLKEDLGETTNLAQGQTEKVQELDTLIDRFVEDTGALYPKPNPAYDPQAKDLKKARK
jgi:arylsulfatase A-like enzyme